MGNRIVRFFLNPFTINIFLAILVSVGLIYGTLKWLDKYTQHNIAVVIPDVKGLTLTKASLFFESNNLKYKVIDSVYSQKVTPGSIVEVVPEVGSKVKKGRIVFVTVNALTSRTAILPMIKDISYRQAYAMLKAAGFENIEIKYVAGLYRDLAISVEANGVPLEENKRINLKTALTLLVSSGDVNYEPNDSLDINGQPIQNLDSDDEKWF